MRARVFENPDGLAEISAAAIAKWLRKADKPTSLALAGGGTPGTTYSRLRDESVPWEEVHVWMGDERWVPPNHPDRNGLMARRVLLDHVPARFHPVPWGDDPREAALEYEDEISGFVVEGRPEVVILGLGEDGHTASLFPGTPALEVKDRLYVANWVAAREAWRLTATLPLLRSARRILFIVTGDHKAEAVAATLEDRATPAARVLEAEANVTWALDRGAASHLTRTELEFV